jgi:hypothetical protein
MGGMRLMLLIPLLLLLLAAPARAGTYDVRGMSSAGFDGWSPAVRAPRG